MRVPRHTKRFRRDYGKLARSGRAIQKLDVALQLLIDGKILPQRYKDHPLKGQWQYLRDCHIEGDWILLYELGLDREGNETVTFHATGTHENLFG